MAAGLLQSFLPAVDESSGALLKFSHGLLSTITILSTLAFTAQALGISFGGMTLSSIAATAASFLMGTAGTAAAAAVTALGVSASASTVPLVVMSGALLTALAPLVGAFVAIAGPVLIAVAALKVFDTAIGALSDYLIGINANTKKIAIQEGNVSAAGRAAEYGSVRASGSLGGMAVGTIGAIIGTLIAPGIGTAIGASLGYGLGSVAGVLVDDLMGFASEARNAAEVQAGAVLITKQLSEAEKDAARGMEEFRHGTKSAFEVLDSFKNASQSIQENRSRVEKTSETALTGQSTVFRGAILRNLGAYLGGGLFGMETAGTRNKRITQEATTATKTQREQEATLFTQSSEARNLAIRSVIARGGNQADAVKRLQERGFESPEEMQARAESFRAKQKEASNAGNAELAAEYDTYATQLEQQAKDFIAGLKNIEQEVKKAQASFNALNLGLRSSLATSSAASLAVSNFAANLEVGSIPIEQNLKVLEAAFTEAAQALNPDAVKAAIEDTSNLLRNFGASDKYIAKFQENSNAFYQAQKGYNEAFDRVKKSIADQDLTQLNPEAFKDKFAKEITAGLGNNVSDEVKKRLSDVISNVDLSEEELSQVLAGNLSVFTNKISQAQKESIKEIVQIQQEKAAVEKQLIEFTKKRIDAERNFLEAQKESLSLMMEGREIQGKFGGRAVTNNERRANVLAQANVGAGRLGLSNLRTGSAEEFRQRNRQLINRFGGIETRRSQQGGLAGVGGTEADAIQQDLAKAQKDQVQTIRELIKLEEDELKIIGEKNKLEKESLESLIKGDIEKFFEQQSAVGATAAVATGNQQLMQAFGQEALGGAFADIQRQQEAGVQSIFGRQIGGVGGLAEQAAGAALASRGIENPLMAQKLAGTTPEEEAAKARLRSLGGALAETGQAGAAMAEMQVATAELNIQQATVIMNDVMQRGNEAAARAQQIENKPASAYQSRGGMIYASNGIFIPRGTDTVPAMLTPGEFVVNRAAVNRGNNLQMLQAMNSGADSAVTAAMARGGVVQYLRRGNRNPVEPMGGMAPANIGGFDAKTISDLSTALNNFNTELAKNITNLQNTKFQIKLDTNSINVNLNGGTFLSQMADSLKSQLLQYVGSVIGQYSNGSNGKLTKNTSTLNK
ncbi:hypothetical protein EB001_16000 [bacterium]|nr:hypothetical protein [bacterium]